MIDEPPESPATSASAKEFAALRPLLFGIAYRMLGSVADAEDIVQESYLRYAKAVESGTQIDSLKAYLAAITTRLCIDHLKSARVRREEYVGLWIPEPLLTDQGFVDAPDAPEEADSLSMAFLLLLERLNPIERAVFLLHDIFGYPHDEVGRMVGKTEANSRKIASRARQAVHSERKATPTREQQQQLATRFFAAMRGGDIEGLLGLLAQNAVVYGDGGGKVPQWMKPIEGAGNVSRLLANLGREIIAAAGQLDAREINGAPGAIVRDREGKVVSTFVLELVDGRVEAFRSVINPEKLGHLGPVADVRALLRERRHDAAGKLAGPP
jgi:RNA polymerase sigma-70 factor (ECF subfamily)